MQEDARLAVAAVGKRRIGGTPCDAHVDAEVAGFRVVETDAGAAQRTLVDDVERTRVVVEVAARGVVEHEAGQLVGHRRSEEHKSELQSLMRNSYDVFCWTQKNT